MVRAGAMRIALAAVQRTHSFFVVKAVTTKFSAMSCTELSMEFLMKKNARAAAEAPGAKLENRAPFPLIGRSVEARGGAGVC